MGTEEVQKFQTRLNAHGGQQIHGISNWDTFAPVVMWTTLRLVLTLRRIYCWKSRQLDFILAYPQADVEGTIFMKLQKGIELDDKKTRKIHAVVEEHIWPKSNGQSLEQASEPGQSELG